MRKPFKSLPVDGAPRTNRILKYTVNCRPILLSLSVTIENPYGGGRDWSGTVPLKIKFVAKWNNIKPGHLTKNTHREEYTKTVRMEVVPCNPKCP